MEIRTIKRIFTKKSTALILAATLAVITGAGAFAVRLPESKTPVAGPVIGGKEAWHVIVAGGEPEGVAAALAAARNGVKTLLIEQGDALGGLMTLGMLNVLDMNFSGSVLLTRGIFKEFYDALGDAFDIEEAKAWFLKKCADEPNLTVMLNTEITGPVMDGNKITGLEVKRPEQSDTEVIRSLAVIDATVDGDVAAAAGAPYTWGGEDYGADWKTQGVTLVFEVSGVHWDAVAEYLKNDGVAESGSDDLKAWGYSSEAQKYKSVDGNMRFRGPNIARQRNGNVLLNALIIFGVDALDPVSYAEGIERGEREIPFIIEFMRGNFAGFEDAAFAGRASRLYVRETRHFIGEYRLTITDVLENRDHWDRVGHGKYPVDIQPTGPNNLGSIVGFPDIYSIPFRCLVPLRIDQLLIAGRSASYDSLPHGSARVIPIGMVAGEACGTAAAYSVLNDVTFREMTQNPVAIRWLQNQLKRRGAFLIEYEPPRPAVMDHWAYPGLAVARELGTAGGGYTNNYRLDEDVPNRWAVQSRFNKLMAVVNERTGSHGGVQVPVYEVSLNTDNITVGRLLLAAARCASMGDKEWLSGQNTALEATPGITPEANPNTAQEANPKPMPFSDAGEAREYLISRGVLDDRNLVYFRELDKSATNGQLMSLLGALYTVLMESP